MDGFDTGRSLRKGSRLFTSSDLLMDGVCRLISEKTTGPFSFPRSSYGKTEKIANQKADTPRVASWLANLFSPPQAAAAACSRKEGRCNSDTKSNPRLASYSSTRFACQPRIGRQASSTSGGEAGGEASNVAFEIAVRTILKLSTPLCLQLTSLAKSMQPRAHGVVLLRHSRRDT
ncbi:hypothetical protein ACLOJK_012734 [Asimina triloba]